MIYCVSFPKCGRTYLRFMIGKYFQLKHNLSELHLLNYATSAEHFGYKHGMKFTHAEFYRDDHIIPFDKLQMQKTIWLRRNPFDVMVSWYHHVVFRKKEVTMSISDFIKTYDYGIVPYITFEVMAEALDNKMIIYYEELVETPELYLNAVLQLMGEKPDTDLLFQAVDESSFEKMREAELSGSVNISEKNYIDKSDTRQLKTRVGKVYNYKNYLSPEDIKFINEEFHHYDKWKQSISKRIRKVLDIS